MTTEIWIDLDPSLDIPIDLVNVNVVPGTNAEGVIPEPDAIIDIQNESLDEDDEALDDEQPADNLDVPSSFVEIEQIIRTAPDGSQVVDVIVDVEEVPGALDYDYRIAPE